jgi:predicted phage-related endonuclease
LKVDVAELGAHLHTSVVIKKELKSFETKVKECQDEIDTIQDQEQAIQEKVRVCYWLTYPFHSLHTD